MSRTRTRNTRISSSTPSLTWTRVNPNGFTVRVTTPTGTLNIATGTTTLSYDCRRGAAHNIDSGEVGTITDESPFPKAMRYNEVQHDKTLWAFPAHGVSQSWDQPCVRASDLSPALPVKCTLTGTFGTGGYNFTVTPPPLTSTVILKNNAINNMNLGEVPADLDLPLFLAELKDFSQVYTNTAEAFATFLRGDLKQVGRGAMTYLQSVFLQGKKGYNSPLDAVDVAVGSDLAWKLAIKPFLEGVRRLRDGFDAINKTYTRVADPRPFRVRGEATATATTGGSWSNSDFYREQISNQLHRRVIIWGLIRRQPIALTAMKSVQATYLLSVRPQIVWELVPLSFVVDWFVDVGRWLAQFDQSILNLKYEVVAGGYSVKDTTTMTRNVGPLQGVQWIGVPTFTLTGARERVQYNRYRDSLQTFGSSLQPIQVGLPNLSQIGTLAELIYALMRR